MDPKEMQESRRIYYQELQNAIEEFCRVNAVYPWEVSSVPEILEDGAIAIRLNYVDQNKTEGE